MSDPLDRLLTRVGRPCTIEHMRIAAARPELAAKRAWPWDQRSSYVRGYLYGTVATVADTADPATRQHIAGRMMAEAAVILATDDEFAAVLASIETAA